MTADPDWIVPAWPARGVGALMSTRRGGVSAGAFASMNLKDGLGDDPADVARNRARFTAALGGARPVWLDQVHGAEVVCVGATGAAEGAPRHRADGCFTTEPGIACCIQVADCLPVLFAAPAGRAVGAAHAGWRGLSLGVLEATARAVADAGGCSVGDLSAWLGPCIGPRRFEVGADVLQAFGAEPAAPSHRFVADRPGKWMADLAGLARDRLAAAGLSDVAGGGWCTVEDGSRFFSFRRDRTTGRMAAAVWIDGR